MSREVRRVPVGWQHPTEPNPYWHAQQAWRVRHHRPMSRLLDPGMRFVPLHRTSVIAAQAEWDRERDDWAAGTHGHLDFLLRYHSAEGYVDVNGIRKVTPYSVCDESGEKVVRSFFPTSAAEIVDVYPYEYYAGQRPDGSDHMPDFDVPADDLGWCLYQTVSEGSPVTPVFASAAELIDHLATVGEDGEEVPLRRAAAEQIVSDGGTVGSFVMVGGSLLDSATDADLIAERLGGAQS